MRPKSHVGCCYLLVTHEVRKIDNKQETKVITKVTKRAIWQDAYLTPTEKAADDHFRELIEIKKENKRKLFKF